MEMTLAILSSSGKWPVFNDCVMINVIGFINSLLICFMCFIDNPS